MYYFGTDLRQAGHFFWDLKGDKMTRANLSFEDIPFDPYDGQKNCDKGTANFERIDDYTVFTITGSCTDKRNGTVSTFFVKERITYNELKERILAIPIAQQIIEKMSFEIDW